MRYFVLQMDVELFPQGSTKILGSIIFQQAQYQVGGRHTHTLEVQEVAVKREGQVQRDTPNVLTVDTLCSIKIHLWASHIIHEHRHVYKIAY